MWRHRENSLHAYLEAIKIECDSRGISTTKNWDVITQMHEANWDRGGNILMPEWWGDERIHQSHRNNLYRKDPNYYAEFMFDSFILIFVPSFNISASYLVWFVKTFIKKYM